MLLKADRIIFTKKIVEADLVLAGLANSKEALQSEKEKAEQLDAAHKRLLDPKTLLINSYQGEIALLDGNVRTTLVEQDYIDSANLILNNTFYPNNITNTVPSLSGSNNIWTRTKPFALTKAKGLTYNETFQSTTTKEQDVITPVKDAIDAIELAYTAIQRTTGQECVSVGGVCSLPAYTDEASCLLNGGVWTPPSDVIDTYVALHDALDDLVVKVNAWKNFLLAEASVVASGDPDPIKEAENEAALDYINNTIIPIINTWLGLPDFDTSHGQTTCVGFNSYDVNLLSNTKLKPNMINQFKLDIASREAFITTRISQISTNLGSISQNLSNGDTSGTGLYFERIKLIGLRMALLGGSLVVAQGLGRAIQGQIEQDSSIRTAKETYETLLRCEALIAPSNGTQTIQVEDSSGFNVGDNVFIVSDAQEEIIRTIESVSNGRIVVGQPVPPKFYDADFARVYKDLT